MENDVMQLTILKDGTIRTVTDEVSAANHDAAESFLRNVAKLAGGKTTREHRHDREHRHEHHHEHESQKA